MQTRLVTSDREDDHAWSSSHPDAALLLMRHEGGTLPWVLFVKRVPLTHAAGANAGDKDKETQTRVHVHPQRYTSGHLVRLYPELDGVLRARIADGSWSTCRLDLSWDDREAGERVTVGTVGLEKNGTGGRR